MQPIKIAIITGDTLIATGLKHLLFNLFDIEAKLYASANEIQRNSDFTTMDLLITDSLQYAANPGFFIPRRSRIVIIADTDSCDDNTCFMLNRYANESSLIARITGIIEQTCATISTGNDLSQREIDVLSQVARGYTNKEIADRLNISINTVLTHRKNITSKLGIKSVSGLSVYAMMNGYITSIPDSQ